MGTNGNHHDTNNASRRDFLKASTAAGAAVALNLKIARGAHAAGSDTIRIALVGCGGRGTAAASQALSTKANVKLMAAADVFKDRMDGCLAYLGKTFKNRFDVPSERRFWASTPIKRQSTAAWTWCC